MDRILDGEADPGAPALLSASATMHHGELGRLVEDRARSLDLGPRSLVVLSGERCIEWVVTYLALLRDGHVPLLVGEQHVDRFAAAWAPDAVVRAGTTGVGCTRADRPPRALHPDLALLLSTSGSTGSPKLVRLSQRNLESNAAAIAGSLGLTTADRGVTSLPLHYCYGLSVLHSHLLAGASVVVTDASVVDPCFVDAVHRLQITNLAGVPHTFEMLERSGPERIRVPSLRLLTQAGGRFAREAAAAWQERSDRWGVELYRMYGQTEATARMAYCPPALGRRCPTAIGHAVAGGSLQLEPVDGLMDGTGELVYRGPNVMMGYATTDADLARGPELTELRTGDLARPLAAEDSFEIVGRRARFVKVLGLRIDLDEIEQGLATTYGEVAVAGDDDGVVAVAPSADCGALRRAVADRAGLPLASVEVAVAAVPRTESGKVDHREVLRRGAALRSARDATAAVSAGTGTGRVAAIYTELLGTQDIGPGTTFVSAGGDSLSYVECSVRLEAVVGALPTDWHLCTVAELEAGSATGTRGLDLTIVLRAVGISTVVATHMKLGYNTGGAHLLLAVAGYNFSRFHLSIERTATRVRAAGRSVARTAIPTVVWVALGMVISGRYGLATLGLVNGYVGDAARTNGRFEFWFIEAYVQLYVALTALTAIPLLRRLDRRFPYGTPLAVFASMLALRAMTWGGFDDLPDMRARAHGIAWIFVLGWLVHRSRRPWQRVLTVAACLATLPGFFENPGRERYVIVGVVLLTWVRAIPLPRAFVPPLAAVSAASMWILISHFRLHPLLTPVLPLPIAFATTIAGGVGLYLVVTTAGRRLRTWWDTSGAGARWPGHPNRVDRAPAARPTARCAAARRRASPRGPARTPG